MIATPHPDRESETVIRLEHEGGRSREYRPSQKTNSSMPSSVVPTDGAARAAKLAWMAES